MKYILGEKAKACVFCTALQQSDGPENLIVFRGQLNFVVLNRFPYTNGHVMIVPNAHIDALDLLDAATRAEMMELTAQSMQVLRQVYHPHGFNVGINEGPAAGAGIHEHMHLHVVPRWNGDNNFMASLANTRIIPEDLEESLRRIMAQWNK